MKKYSNLQKEILKLYRDCVKLSYKKEVLLNNLIAQR
jgi:hypothetical protein